MLFEIDGVNAHEEDAWIGVEVRIGDATVVFKRRHRPLRRHLARPRHRLIDLPTLVTLASYRPDGVTEPLPFGVYGSVLVAGRVRVGDTASPLSPVRHSIARQLACHISRSIRAERQ